MSSVNAELYKKQLQVVYDKYANDAKLLPVIHKVFDDFFSCPIGEHRICVIVDDMVRSMPMNLFADEFRRLIFIGDAQKVAILAYNLRELELEMEI